MTEDRAEVIKVLTSFFQMDFIFAKQTTSRLLLQLYRAVGGSVALALVVQWARSWAGYYTGPSVCDRVEQGPGVDGSWCV